MHKVNNQLGIRIIKAVLLNNYIPMLVGMLSKYLANKTSFDGSKNVEYHARHNNRYWRYVSDIGKEDSEQKNIFVRRLKMLTVPSILSYITHSSTDELVRAVGGIVNFDLG